MYCPNCKTEYEPEITVCPDCGADLVPELPDEELSEVLRFKSELVAEKFNEYLHYSNIESSMEYHEDCDRYVIMAKESAMEDVQKAFYAFITVETSKEDVLEDLLDEDIVSDMRTGRFRPYEELEYTSASFKAKDTYSSGVTFLAVGIIGLIVAVLAVTNIIPFFLETPFIILMGALFIAMIVYGIHILTHMGEMKEAVNKEEQLLKDIAEWQKENLTEEVLQKAVESSVGEGSESTLLDEEKDILLSDYVRERTKQQFPTLSADLLEHTVDEFLDSRIIEK